MPSMLERIGRWNLRRQGARDLYLDVEGVRLHAYELEGEGSEPLVLLHGIGSTAVTFGPLLKRLRPYFGRIILPEAPAHGYSQPPEEALDAEGFFSYVCAVLDATLDVPFSLYGNSLGGAAAIRYAMERPGRVSRLMLLAPAGARMDAASLEALTRTFELSSVAEARAFVRRLFHRPRWWTRFAARDLRRRLHHPMVRGFLATARVEDQLDGARLAALSMPILFMWGGAERVLPGEHLSWYKAHLPLGTHLVEPPHFGHSAYIEYPDDVARELLTFAGLGPLGDGATGPVDPEGAPAGGA